MAAPDAPDQQTPIGSSSSYSDYLSNFLTEVISSPVNLALVAVIALLVYKIIKSRQRQDEPVYRYKELPKMRRDFTVEELKPYNGTEDAEDGRILVAVNGSVYDVTKGARFYGPGGPYAAFGGRDASRGLATFSVVPGKDEYDDLSDLNTDEMNSVKEWEEQFKERYDYVGKLLKPGEAHTDYSYEEEESSGQQESDTKAESGATTAGAAAKSKDE